MHIVEYKHIYIVLEETKKNTFDASTGQNFNFSEKLPL